MTKDLWDRQIDMKVGETCQSSHFPLEVKVNLSSMTDDRKLNDSIEIIRYKWDSKKEMDVISRIVSNESRLFLIGVNHMIDSNKIDEAATILQKWIVYISKDLEIPKYCGSKIVFKDEWYDLECRKNREKQKIN